MYDAHMSNAGGQMTRAERERRSAEIRAWAAEHWHEDLSPRGRIPGDVVDAYYQAKGVMTGPPTPDDDDAEPPASGDVSRETSPQDPPSPAPLEEEIEPDPAPSRPRGRRRGKARSARPKTARRIVIDDDTRDQVRAQLAMLSLVPLAAAEHFDPHCGGALNDVRDPLLEWCVNEICRSPAAVSWFVMGDGVMRFAELAAILRTFLVTFWAHHVSHSIGDDTGGDSASQPVYTADPSAAGLYVAASGA